MSIFTMFKRDRPITRYHILTRLMERISIDRDYYNLIDFKEDDYWFLVKNGFMVWDEGKIYFRGKEIRGLSE